jgi:hypothetical protein
MRQQKVRIKKSSFCTSFLSPGARSLPRRYSTNLFPMSPRVEEQGLLSSVEPRLNFGASRRWWSRPYIFWGKLGPLSPEVASSLVRARSKPAKISPPHGYTKTILPSDHQPRVGSFFYLQTDPIAETWSRRVGRRRIRAETAMVTARSFAPTRRIVRCRGRLL